MKKSNDSWTWRRILLTSLKFTLVFGIINLIYNWINIPADDFNLQTVLSVLTNAAIFFGLFFIVFKISRVIMKILYFEEYSKEDLIMSIISGISFGGVIQIIFNKIGDYDSSLFVIILILLINLICCIFTGGVSQLITGKIKLSLWMSFISGIFFVSSTIISGTLFNITWFEYAKKLISLGEINFGLFSSILILVNCLFILSFLSFLGLIYSIKFLSKKYPKTVGDWFISR